MGSKEPCSYVTHCGSWERASGADGGALEAFKGTNPGGGMEPAKVLKLLIL